VCLFEILLNDHHSLLAKLRQPNKNN
jgi:hypothetical protein